MTSNFTTHTGINSEFYCNHIVRHLFEFSKLILSNRNHLVIIKDIYKFHIHIIKKDRPFLLIRKQICNDLRNSDWHIHVVFFCNFYNINSCLDKFSPHSNIARYDTTIIICSAKHTVSSIAFKETDKFGKLQIIFKFGNYKNKGLMLKHCFVMSLDKGTNHFLSRTFANLILGLVANTCYSLNILKHVVVRLEYFIASRNNSHINLQKCVKLLVMVSSVLMTFIL